jgi:hypothetical protein
MRQQCAFRVTQSFYHYQKGLIVYQKLVHTSKCIWFTKRLVTRNEAQWTLAILVTDDVVCAYYKDGVFWAFLSSQYERYFRIKIL